MSVAWEIFGRSNGTDNYNNLKSKITGYRRDNQPNPVIGCIILTDPVFFNEEDWIPVPPDWASSIVQGKSYNTDDPIGNQLWSQVTYLLRRYKWLDRQVTTEQQLVAEPTAPEYREILARVRVGQGTFRALVTDVYQRRCAISGEKTLPVLEAAHIKPYAQSGPHAINNGLLLRSDLHKLFDTGYITLTNDLQVEVSGRIREEFENGKEYYRFQGQKMHILPQQINQQPDPQYLTWHQDNVFNG
ncbi:MAG: HNH endonuclease [Saprospiraceae bacterium]